MFAHHALRDRLLADPASAGGEAGIIGRGREENAVRKNGEAFPILLTVSEVQQPGGRHFVGFVRDLSETRAAEEQVRRLENRLLHADRLVTLGELTAGIAHEINQPLTAIAAYADAGRSLSGGSDDALRRELVTIFERIGGQSRRAAEVVRRLRKMVRGGTVQKARHDINQIISIFFPIAVLLVMSRCINCNEGGV